MDTFFFISLSVCLILYIYTRVKKKLFSEKESFFWVLGSFLILLLSIFPKSIDYFSAILGIAYPPSLLFLISILFVVFLLFRQNQIISVMNERIKELGQMVSLLEVKIRSLTERNDRV
jgi:hypothetical protein